MRPGTGSHPVAASTDICHAVGLNARSSSEVQTPRTLSEPSGVPSVWRRSPDGAMVTGCYCFTGKPKRVTYTYIEA
jgi:hypothetical protein